MKKLTMLAVAAIVAFGFASCAKESSGGDAGETTTLAIRVSGVSTTSNPVVRSVEEPGTPGQLQISSGTILITDGSGDVVVHSVPLDYATASTTGQLINDIPASSANVYIVANATVVNGDLSTVFADAKSIGSQSNYRSVALANDGGSPVAINIAPLGSLTPSTASVTLVPLISRVELHSIVGGENMADNTDDDYVKITGFTVEGVYLDSYYPAFTLDGKENGTLVSEGQDSGFAIGDIGPWAAADDAGVITAKASATDIWAHNVVAKGAPRFIIKLSNVTAEDGSGTPVTEIQDNLQPSDPTATVTLASQTFWLSMNPTMPYNGVTSFARGKIYVVDALEFNSNHLFTLPNPLQLNLSVNVTVQDWTIEPVTGNL